MKDNAVAEALEVSGDDLLALCDALEGFGDDYMTSEKHHPADVLIPAEVFDRVCVARELSVKLKTQAQRVDEGGVS